MLENNWPALLIFFNTLSEDIFFYFLKCPFEFNHTFFIALLKAYELSTLTGTQVMLLVASETGHVYTFATRKLQPMITSESGKALIQTCLNSPDPPVSQIPNPDQRMSATGYEETDLTYTVNENDAEKMQVSGIFVLEFTVQYSSNLPVSLYVLCQR